MNDIQIRHAEPEDYAPIIIVLDGWFDGRHVSSMLHKLFFIHFRQRSFVVEKEGKLVGFLVGFLSQTFHDGKGRPLSMMRKRNSHLSLGATEIGG